MRSVMTKLMLVAAIVFGTGLIAARPVLADGGMGPFNPGDGRYNPEVGDRLAIYLTDTGVIVWGVDNNNNGFFLTSFSAAEFQSGKTVSHLTTEGTVTLYKNASAITETGYSDYSATSLSTIVVQSAQYTISWRGGSFGANGSANFTKTLFVNY